MKRKLVVITRTIPQIGVDLLRKNRFLVKMSPHHRLLTAQELGKLVGGAHGIISLLTDRISSVVMDSAGKNLKIIANFAVGYDNIDVSAAHSRGIVVTNTPEVLSTAVAEHTFALMLGCAKRLVEADAFTRAEKYRGWDPLLFLGVELHHKTLGIIGVGRIGSMVVRMAVSAFGMKVLYSDPNRKPEFENEFGARHMSLQRLLHLSDVVTIHVPLTPKTRHLISRKELALMKKSAILINTSRGPVVDEKALTEALLKRKIFAAGLDVYECEPAIDCDVRDDLELKTLPNIIMTPHIASATHEARNEMSLLAAKNVIAVLKGKKPLTPVV